MSLFDLEDSEIIGAFLFYVIMENLKITKEQILELKEDSNFNFYTKNIADYFNVSPQRMTDLLRYYNIEVKKLTKNVRLTTEEWIQACQEVHGSTYDYSKSNYKNLHTLITIGCPVHGDIKVNPSRHKNGSGCKRCSSKKHSIFKSMDKEVFIESCKKTHKNKYDYSLVEDFKGMHSRITIICPKHGEFEQIAHGHKRCHGCEKCSYEERGRNSSVSFKEFKDLAENKFGNLYTYDENSYTKISEDVSYKCDVHGVVKQRANLHLKGKGCSKCFSKNIKHTTESFIEKATLKHKGFYNYEKTKYGSKNTDKVVITCPFHGDFLQAPMGHLYSQGCTVCANIKSNIGYQGLATDFIEHSKLIDCVTYLLKFNSETLSYYKVGISTNMTQRLHKLRKVHNADIEVLFEFKSSLFNCADVENELLVLYKNYNRRGEVPYKIEGSTECFSIKAPIDEMIKFLSEKKY